MHNTCVPTSITIRDVPTEARNELAARAARSGRSLQEYLRGELIEMARRPDMDTLMARVSARKDTTNTQLPPESILDHLDADRR